jgi:hypothetical protein
VFLPSKRARESFAIDNHIVFDGGTSDASWTLPSGVRCLIIDAEHRSVHDIVDRIVHFVYRERYMIILVNVDDITNNMNITDEYTDDHIYVKNCMKNYERVSSGTV